MNPAQRFCSLHANLVEAVRQLGNVEHRLATMLAEVEADKLYRTAGYATLAEYVERSLSLAPRKARALMPLGRAMPQLPALEPSSPRGRVP